MRIPETLKYWLAGITVLLLLVSPVIIEFFYPGFLKELFSAVMILYGLAVLFAILVPIPIEIGRFILGGEEDDDNEMDKSGGRD